MNYDIDDLVLKLPRVDTSAETAARVRGEASAILRRGCSARGRFRVSVARVYTQLLEPALLLGTVGFLLSWAVERIVFILQ